MKITWILISLCLLVVAPAQEEGYEPVDVDGSQMDEALFLKTVKKPTRQIAPEIPARLLELAETVHPPFQPTGQPGAAAPATQPIGYLGGVPEGLFEAAPWYTTRDGGRIKRLELRSQNATALRVIMTDIGKMELRVYDPKEQYTFGPYFSPRLNEDGTWWSTVVFGDTIGLEFYLPPDQLFPPRVMPQIVGIFYMYANFQEWFSDFEPTGACYVDAVCYASWINSIEGNAIGRLMGSTGCTGALINRNPSDLAPIVMTARHCITNQADANGVIVIWFWQNQTCNGNNPPNLNSLPRNDGALLLKTDFEAEWTLMGLYEPPGSGSYVGWSSGYWDDGGGATNISHPGGRPKRITFGTKTDDRNCLGGASFYTEWGTGTVTGGSSGSPVFDSSRRVRGTMSCATDTDGDGTGGPCAPDSWFGRLDIGFPELRYYLFQMASPTYVNRGVGGDPGNDGSSERGTVANPFNTAYEGTFCIPTQGTVVIQAGNYNERFTIWRPMTLSAQGGLVRIGTP